MLKNFLFPGALRREDERLVAECAALLATLAVLAGAYGVYFSLFYTNSGLLRALLTGCLAALATGGFIAFLYVKLPWQEVISVAVGSSGAFLSMATLPNFISAILLGLISVALITRPLSRQMQRIKPPGIFS